MTQYIERGGEQVWRTPYGLQKSLLHNFLLPAKIENLQALCDRTLNHLTPNVVHYQVLMPYVSLVILDNEKVFSRHPEDRAKGWFPEIDVAFWILTLVSQPIGGLWVPLRIAWFMPYLFIDSVMAILAGREIAGFHKMPATFSIPKLTEPADVFSVNAFGVKKFAPNSCWQELPLFSVRRKNNLNSSDGSHTKDWNDLWSASRDVGRIFAQSVGGIPGGIMETINNLSPIPGLETVPMVLLKQFRDISDPQTACYQSICECYGKIDHFRQGGLLRGEYEFCLNHLDSHPLAEDLGLQVGTQEVKSGYWFDYDFSMLTGKEIWRSDQASPLNAESRRIQVSPFRINKVW